MKQQMKQITYFGETYTAYDWVRYVVTCPSGKVVGCGNKPYISGEYYDNWYSVGSLYAPIGHKENCCADCWRDSMREV